VLPQARMCFSPEKQRELSYKSLCVMPLKLLEHVLPWFVSKLGDDDASLFLQNMRLAGNLFASLVLHAFFYTFQYLSIILQNSIFAKTSVHEQHHHLKLHWSLFSLVGRAKLGTNPTLENIYAQRQGQQGT
jgi:hypothetical protein